MTSQAYQWNGITGTAKHREQAVSPDTKRSKRANGIGGYQAGSTRQTVSTDTKKEQKGQTVSAATRQKQTVSADTKRSERYQRIQKRDTYQ
jgi:hypothetical protein